MDMMLASALTLALGCKTGGEAELDLTVWKGETLNAFLPAGKTVSGVPEGWEARIGEILAVPYASKPGGEVDSEAFDRVRFINANGRDKRVGSGGGESAAAAKVVQVKAPRDAAAGTYRMGDLNVKVLDRTITPVGERKYYLDLWQHPWAVARWKGVEAFSK